jgi:hypothetical protein
MESVKPIPTGFTRPLSVPIRRLKQKAAASADFI